MYLNRALKPGVCRVTPGWILAIALCCGCASSNSSNVTSNAPPTPREISFPALGDLVIYNEPGVGARMLQADPNTIFRTLPAVYEVLQIPVQVLNEQEFQIGNPGFRTRQLEGRRLSSFLDCGLGSSGQRADTYEVTLFVATRLIEEGPAQTIVQTTVDASARPRAVSGNPVQCASRGNLEMRVAELVAEALMLY